MSFKNILYIILIFPCQIFAGLPADSAQITFIVSTMALEEGENVYISGNQKKLGFWNPGLVSLEVADNNRFLLTLFFPISTELEFKFTPGSWEREMLNDNGSAPGNFKHLVKKDTTLFFNITKWKTTLPGEKSPTGITGSVEYLKKLSYPGIPDRDVIVWLPPGYEEESQSRYPVLYMNDGQNVFDPITSFAGKDWRADEVADSLIKAHKIKKVIIVAIYNTRHRTAEYSESHMGSNYQKFIIKKLKPLIDDKYRTMEGPENNIIMGSSMGGLVSFIMAWKYPHIFGGAGCFSPAFVDTFSIIIDDVRNTPFKKDTKIYMDNGTIGLETRLQPGCEQMLKALKDKGYKIGNHLMWYQDEGASHNEAAWSKRIWRALEFFFAIH